MNRILSGHSQGARWLLLSLLTVSLYGCEGDRAELVTVSSEKEANRILVALETRGVTTARGQQKLHSGPPAQDQCPLADPEKVSGCTQNDGTPPQP